MTRTSAPRIARLAVLGVCAAAMLLLALATGAQARQATCSAAAAHRAAHGTHACTQSRRHHKGPAHHARKHARGHTKGDGAGSSGAHEAPTCEDGSSATHSGSATPTCADGSEPRCALDATPSFASDGSVIYCTPSKETGSTFGEGGAPEAALTPCADGTLANANGEGSYVCDDASEPHCPAGYVLTLTETGDALACDPQSEDA
jgi:hypothetical protein